MSHTLAEWSGDGGIEQRWRARLEGVALNLVLTSDDEPVGMVDATAPGAKQEVELISLWVAPGSRGRGIGVRASARCWRGYVESTQPAAWCCRSRRATTTPAGCIAAMDGPSLDDPDERLMRR